MKRVVVRELKARLSEYLAQVKTGEEVVITERGRPIAVLSPVAPSDGLPERLVEMEREGLVRVGAGHLPEGFLGRVRVKDPEGRALQVLKLDRDEGL